jgi:imidazolonepropionase-like amidohydrolase
MAHIDDQKLKSDPSLKYVPAAIRNSWAGSAGTGNAWAGDAGRESAVSEAQVQGAYRLVRLMKRSGVEVLAATHTGDPYTVPGATLHDELEQLVAAGLTPAQALESATLAPARLLAWDRAMGTVDMGKVADLVLLGANPLENIRNTRKIEAVFARGKYYSRKDLDAILAAVQ